MGIVFRPKGLRFIIVFQKTGFLPFEIDGCRSGGGVLGLEIRSDLCGMSSRGILSL